MKPEKAVNQREHPGIDIYHEVDHASVRIAKLAKGEQGFFKNTYENKVFQKSLPMGSSLIELRLSALHGKDTIFCGFQSA